jgi:hypothetical protein
MGAIKALYTGHTELRPYFERKGALVKIKNKDIRLIIKYKQIAHKEWYGFIYECDYDSHIFYHVFQEKYTTTQDGATITQYPNDDAFRENDSQWAWVANTLEEAQQIFDSIESIF